MSCIIRHNILVFFLSHMVLLGWFVLDLHLPKQFPWTQYTFINLKLFCGFFILICFSFCFYKIKKTRRRYERIHATFTKNIVITKNELQFSSNWLTDWFFCNWFIILQFWNYQKSIMILSDLFKSNSTISGPPCVLE